MMQQICFGDGGGLIWVGDHEMMQQICFGDGGGANLSGWPRDDALLETVEHIVKNRSYTQAC